MSIMDAEFSSFTILLSFFIFLITLLSVTTWCKTKSKSTLNFPPGPRKLPFIGNLHLFSSFHPPHRTLGDLALKYGPLMHLQLGEVTTFVVSSAEAAKEVMKKHDITFANRPSLLAPEIMCYANTDIAFAPYGDYWRRLRKICTLELLTTKRVQSFRPIREEEFSNLCGWIASKERSSLNLTEKVDLTNNDIVVRASLGKKTKEQATFMSIIKESIELAAGFHIGDLYPSIKLFGLISGMRGKIERLHQESDRILGNIINEHKVANALLRTGYVQCWNRNIIHNYRLGYVRNAETPKNPVKTRVLVNAWAIGRDPKYWNEPESFKPERFLDSSVDYKGNNFEYIPFGAGRRICPGLSFGLANVELPLAMFLYHFDWILPNGMKPEEVDMTESFGVTARRANPLYVIPIIKKPLPVIRNKSLDDCNKVGAH